MSEKTGHKLELRDATDALAEAVTAGDAALLRRAAGAHATALNSQATAMAASIAEPLYTKLGALSEQIKELATIVTNARQADLTWRTEERTTRDAQSSRLYEELDAVLSAVQDGAARLGKLEQEQHGLVQRLDTDEARLDRKRAQLDDHEKRLHEIERLLHERPAQRAAEHQAIVDAVIAGLKAHAAAE